LLIFLQRIYPLLILAATDNPLLKISNGLSVANCQQRIIRCKTSNGLSVAAKSATDKSVASFVNQQRILRC
jgi:hypothetical protein